MQEKYIKLLVERCLDINNSKSLFIHYNKLNEDFVMKLKEYVNDLGINDIYLDGIDYFELHDILKNSSVKDIKSNHDLDCHMWDEYAKKDAAFLILESEIPHLMDDIDEEVFKEYLLIKRTTKPIYKEKQLNGVIPWCIAALPNKYWSKEIFNNDNSEDLFWNYICKICMLENDNPISKWNEFLDYQTFIVNKLNNLHIKSLIYKNSLGTNLKVYLSDKTIWASASSGKWIVNMPSYEVFTTPIYDKTEGIVYSSKPLIYNGVTIDNFWIKFKNGKVIEYDAREGQSALKSIIESDEYSAYLGECALVNYDSPISKTNIVYKTTLIDENASCHLALGAGFNECIINGFNLSKEELFELGVNPSKNHVDFMIGTSDLEIIAETNNGNITIMKDGNLVL